MDLDGDGRVSWAELQRGQYIPMQYQYVQQNPVRYMMTGGTPNEPKFITQTVPSTQTIRKVVRPPVRYETITETVMEPKKLLVTTYRDQVINNIYREQVINNIYREQVPPRSCGLGVGGCGLRVAVFGGLVGN